MRSLTACLESWAASQPDQPLFGFIGADGRPSDGYTYRSFLDRTRRLAASLAARDRLAWGERVLLAYPPGLDLVVAFFACARLGVIPVPVVPPDATGGAAAVNALGLIAADCAASAVLSCAALCELAARRGGAAAPRWIATDGPPDGAAREAADAPNPVLFLQYTSGSTGDPRGVIVSHANVIHNAGATIDHVPVGVSWLPQYHDMGLIGYGLFPVVCGGASYGLSAQDFLKRPALWLQSISRLRATYTSSPNFGFEYCLRPGRIRPEHLQGGDLASLRVLMNAAEPVRAETRQRFIERFAPHGLDPAACVVAYGLAENTLAATHYGRRVLALDKAALSRQRVRLADDGARPDARVLVASCGKPLDGVRLRIVDGPGRRALGARRIGEIWIAGASVCQGYWRGGRAQRDVFGQRLADPADDGHAYLRTGDLGFVDDGELFVCGRGKDLIIVRGVNHYPQDIEAAAAAASAAIRPGGVAAFNGPDETLVVVVEARRRAVLPDPAAIARAVRTGCLVSPDLIVLAPPHAIARTTSGKIARQPTRARFAAATLPCLLVYREPAGAGLRQRFARLLAGAAGDGGGVTVADAGLDSLMLTELQLELEGALRQRGAGDLCDEIDAALLQRLTAAQFCGLLDRIDDGGADAIAALRAELRRSRGDFEHDIGRRMRCDAQPDWRDRAAGRAEPSARAEQAERAGQAGQTGRAGRPGQVQSAAPLELAGPLAPDEAPATDMLLTGVTGFFGPFLLKSLLVQTRGACHLLVRAADAGAAARRVREALRRADLLSPWLEAQLASRARFVCGDLAQANLGLAAGVWDGLTRRVGAVIHNGAAVNYVANYEALKPHNIDGTRTMLRFAGSGRDKRFHYISSTFIFGWSARGLLFERDNNSDMASLDFGYAQTKWVAEQLVLDARARGLDARVYRPSLISVSSGGAGDRNDVAVRLLAFMINHGIAVDSGNQVSILPADVAADNIVAIAGQRDVGAGTFHVTVDDYYNMADLTRALSRQYGYAFTYHDIPGFIEQMNRRCTRADPLYALLDFFNRSASRIAAMQLKRYRNDQYRAARQRCAAARPDPSLADTVGCLVAYLRAQGMIRVAPAVPPGERASPNG